MISLGFTDVVQEPLRYFGLLLSMPDLHYICESSLKWVMIGKSC